MVKKKPTKNEMFWQAVQELADNSESVKELNQKLEVFLACQTIIKRVPAEKKQILLRVTSNKLIEAYKELTKSNKYYGAVAQGYENHIKMITEDFDDCVPDWVLNSFVLSGRREIRKTYYKHHPDVVELEALMRASAHMQAHHCQHNAYIEKRLKELTNNWDGRYIANLPLIDDVMFDRQAQLACMTEPECTHVKHIKDA